MMTIKKLTKIVLAVWLGLRVMSCEHSNPAASQNSVPLAATLSSIQANVFTPMCVNAGCHPGGGAPMSLAAGQSFNTLVGVPSAYGNLLRVQQGNALQSALYLKIAGNTLGARMPTGGAPVPQAMLDSTAAWINAGALNN